MEYSVTRLIGLGVALALVAALSVIVWNIMSTRAPAESPSADYERITTYELCKAVGGKKKVGTNAAGTITTETGAIPSGTLCVKP